MSDLSDIFTGIGQFTTNFFGETMTFTRNNVGEFDPETGQTAAVYPLTTTYSGTGVPTTFSSFEKANGLVEENDLKITLENVSTEPLIGDTVPISGKTYRVENVKETVVNGVVVLYTLQVRL